MTTNTTAYPIAIRPTTGRRYMLTGGVMFRFDGTPVEQPADAANWEVVGRATCLFDWQQQGGA